MGRILLLSILALVVAAIPSAAEDQLTTLTGEYRVVGDPQVEPLEAVFIPIGSGLWEVTFQFRFQGQPHEYAGTANGNLAAGRLEGEVKNENRRRTFLIRGNFSDGTYTGKHFEIDRRGREEYTGTLTLSAD